MFPFIIFPSRKPLKPSWNLKEEKEKSEYVLP
jgi:hypothetical protein